MSNEELSVANVAKKTSWVRALLLMTFIVITLVTAALWYANHWLSQFTEQPQVSITTQLFNVNSGDTAKLVIAKLAKQQTIVYPLAYRLMLWQQPQLAKLKVGHYRLSNNMTPRALFEQLTSGIDAQFSVTLVEGTTFVQWLNTLQQHQFIDKTPLNESQLAALRGDNIAQTEQYPHANFEGLFYPDTYHFSANSSPSLILGRAKKKLSETLDKLWAKRQAGLPLKSPYQALILASIIEKETGVASERKTIASVFVNRLRKRMRLQTDPTVIYGVGEDYDGDITRAHLRDKTPYNTYRIDGLPPTPISMVSEESLIAALNPATTPYYYFVAAGDGSHYFSKTLREHNLAVRRYLSLTKNK